MLERLRDYYVVERRTVTAGELAEMGLTPESEGVRRLGDRYVVERREYADRYVARLPGGRVEVVQELESEKPAFRESRRGERSWRVSVSRRTPEGRRYELEVALNGPALEIQLSLGVARKRRLYFISRGRLEWLPLRVCPRCQRPMVTREAAAELGEGVAIAAGNLCLACGLEARG